jgi:methyltransferase, fkbM family
MKMITQAIYSHRYKGWSIPETCWYILMRASSRLNVGASFFYRRYKKRSNNDFARKWRRRHGDDFVFDFNGVLFPDVSGDFNLLSGLKYVFDDVYLIPIYFQNDYSQKNVALVDQFTAEGPYGLVSEQVDVKVEQGDVVFDVGAWIGDFSALAAAQGAAVYAFEPTPDTHKWLCRTASLSKGKIIPIQRALGDKCEEIELFLDNSGGGANKLHIQQKPTNKEKSIEDSALPLVKVTTIDQFVSENQLRKVDFIKADIEGAERYMLNGATETLRRFAPKLAICTYHLKDDPQVLEGIIKEANPAYTIVHTRHKLFASVKR